MEDSDGYDFTKLRNFVSDGWAAPNMSAVDEDGEGMRILAFAYWRSLIGDGLGDFAEAISDGGVVLPGTGQKGLQYPSCLPK